MSFTYSLATLANNANVLVNSISVNATAITSHSVGTSFVANATQITIAGVPLNANGSNGTATQVLTSNGSTGSPYWATASGGSGNPFPSTGISVSVKMLVIVQLML